MKGFSHEKTFRMPLRRHPAGRRFSTDGSEYRARLSTSACRKHPPPPNMPALGTGTKIWGKNETFFGTFRILTYQEMVVNNFFWKKMAIIGKIVVTLQSEK